MDENESRLIGSILFTDTSKKNYQFPSLERSRTAPPVFDTRGSVCILIHESKNEFLEFKH